MDNTYDGLLINSYHFFDSYFVLNNKNYNYKPPYKLHFEIYNGRGTCAYNSTESVDSLKQLPQNIAELIKSDDFLQNYILSCDDDIICNFKITLCANSNRKFHIEFKINSTELKNLL